MKFFLDANIPYSSMHIFKKFGHDAEHARKIGMANADDTEIIEHAKKHNRVLVSKDLGFGNVKNHQSQIGGMKRKLYHSLTLMVVFDSANSTNIFPLIIDLVEF